MRPSLTPTPTAPRVTCAEISISAKHTRYSVVDAASTVSCSSETQKKNGKPIRTLPARLASAVKVIAPFSFGSSPALVYSLHDRMMKICWPKVATTLSRPAALNSIE